MSMSGSLPTGAQATYQQPATLLKNETLPPTPAAIRGYTTDESDTISPSNHWLPIHPGGWAIGTFLPLVNWSHSQSFVGLV